jgi:hypothetical protein
MRLVERLPSCSFHEHRSRLHWRLRHRCRFVTNRELPLQLRPALNLDAFWSESRSGYPLPSTTLPLHPHRVRADSRHACCIAGAGNAAMLLRISPDSRDSWPDTIRTIVAFNLWRCCVLLRNASPPLTLGTLGLPFMMNSLSNADRADDHSGYVYKGVSYRSAQRVLQKTRPSRRTSCSTHTGFSQ